jgi:hypothetical protein
MTDYISLHTSTYMRRPCTLVCDGKTQCCTFFPHPLHKCTHSPGQFGFFEIERWMKTYHHYLNRWMIMNLCCFCVCVKGIPFPTTDPVRAQPANPLTLCMFLHTSDLTGFAHGLTCHSSAHPLPDRLYSFTIFLSYCLLLLTSHHL